MDTNELITANRADLRRLGRLSRDPLRPLPDEVEAALWEQAEQAASRPRRPAKWERVPVPVKRHPGQPLRAESENSGEIQAR